MGPNTSSTGGQFATSPDGINWTYRTMPFSFDESFTIVNGPSENSFIGVGGTNLIANARLDSQKLQVPVSLDSGLASTITWS
jgi:hypothetical protein